MGIRAFVDELPRGDRLPAATWERRHRVLAWVLLAHAAALPVVGLAAGVAPVRALVEGALLPAALALAGLRSRAERRLRGALVAVGLASCSALLVDLSGGAAAHYHAFAALLLVSLYGDRLLLALAVGVVVAADVVRGDGAHAVAALLFSAVLALDWRLGASLSTERDAREEELRRANVELLELDRIRSEFVAVASHELRTPLTSVLGFAATLQERWDLLQDEERRRYVGVIEQQAERLRRLVGDLLDLSRIDAGTLPVRHERVELAPILRRVDASLGTDAVIACSDDAAAWADPAHVEQIVLNLLGNAKKHGEAPFRLEVGNGSDDVELRVRDAGSGVPEEFADRLFDTFSQAEAETSGGGSGLGLAIVLGLAELNGGTAWYERGARGATFAVRLPAAA